MGNFKFFNQNQNLKWCKQKNNRRNIYGNIMLLRKTAFNYALIVVIQFLVLFKCETDFM